MTGYGRWLCVLVGCSLLWVSPVFAKEVHVFRSSFGSLGVGALQFDRPRGLGVNEATHDLYVVDSGNDRVEILSSDGSVLLGEFNGSGAPDGSFSEPTEIAVDNSGLGPSDPSAGDVYVLDRGHGVIDKFDSTGHYIAQLNGADTPGGLFEPGEAETKSITGVAVDAKGDVWVTIYKGPIYKFSDAQENKYLSQRVTAFGLGDGVAVDGEENLYVDIVREFAKVNVSGETLIHSFGNDLQAYRVAVDVPGKEVYLDNRDSIEAFDLDGAPVESCIAPANECFGLGHLEFSKGIAVDGSSGTVYVSDESLDTVSIFEGIVLPDVSMSAVTGQQTRAVTLNGTVNPHGRPVTSCVFEFGTTGAYGQSVPCSPASLGEESTPVSVSAQLSGLTPGTEYHYRLVAQNGAPVSSVTADHTFFTGPLLGGESVVDVTSSSATLLDTVDANGADTHYYVQFGSSEAYGSFAPVPAPGVDIGSSAGAQHLSVHLEGLEAVADYHYRFVAVQDGESFAEPDRVFRTQSLQLTGALPDGRAWELVSPADKRGAVLELTEVGGQIQAASDGSGITYVGEGPSVDPDAGGKSTYSQFLSRRVGGVWNTTDLTLPGRVLENGEPGETIFKIGFNYRLFSSDLSGAAVEPQAAGTPLLSPEASTRTLYLRSNINGVFTPLVTPSDVPENTTIEEENFFGANPDDWQMHFLAGTPDLSHVVFESPKALTSEAIDEETIKGDVERHESTYHPTHRNLYEWSGQGLRLINILPPPGNEVVHGRDSSVPSATLAGVSVAGGGGEGLPAGNAQRSVSVDGRRVAWSWGEPYTPSDLTRYRGLYVRDMVEERTVRVGGPAAVYQTMNSDGSKIFFVEGGDLYVYDWDTGVQTDLTAEHGVDESDAGVQQVVSGVSEDGAYVYFVATGVLAEGGVSGEYNLYLLHDTGAGWSTVRVSTLAAEDLQSWYGEWFTAPYLAAVSSRVSPDGRYFAFMSQRSLTGYDNVDAVSGARDEEVFLYDAQGGGRLVCASCDPTGARPTGIFDGNGARPLVDREQFWSGVRASSSYPAVDHWLAGSVPGWDNLDNVPATYQPRYLSDSGRLFFDSPVGLVAQDTNGLEDVYQYEPAGVGDCTSVGVGFVARSQGCVGLLSSGTSSAESAFYDASESGGDVFFTTTSKLVSNDFDKGYDVYDAHLCTAGVPCVSAPVAVPPCVSGDSCKAAASAQPQIFGPAPSATFSGAGNVVSTPVRSSTLTNAKRLARALRTCRRSEKGPRRKVCERRARKRYPQKRARKSGVVRSGGKG